MTLQLKAILADAAITHDELARDLGISRSALSVLINHGHYPASTDRRAIRDGVNRFLHDRGVDATHALNKSTPSRANATASVPNPTVTKDEEVQMLLRKQTLSQAARKLFGLTRDPFGDVTKAEDVFLSPDIRYVREAMWEKVRHGGFLAVVGESGAGKTTLREELVDRIQREGLPTIVATPYVLAMEDNDIKGKTLKSQHVAEAVMGAVAPLVSLKSSPEARFRQLHNALKESHKAGYMHVLMIEEAHSLPITTLKHLKRFAELKDGMRPLLAIVLLGQSELALKLSEHDPQVREVVQRIEIVQLPPLDAQLEQYLKHRFDRAGVPLARVLDNGAIEALRARLTPNDKRRSDGSLLYPLVVHNVLTAAMNAAAEAHIERVSADLIKGV